MIDEINLDELRNKHLWVQKAKKGDRVLYAIATHLLDSKHNARMRIMFWKFYKEGLVTLVQKKIRTDGTLHAYFEYYAIRTETPFKESWNI